LIVDEVGDAQLTLDQNASVLLGLVFLPRFVISHRCRSISRCWYVSRIADQVTTARTKYTADGGTSPPAPAAAPMIAPVAAPKPPTSKVPFSWVLSGGPITF
jgi:hypothetical protein